MATDKTINTDTSGSRLAWLGAWALLSLLVTVLWFVSFRPNADLDDVMKLLEIRLLLDTGDIFNRTIPGIAQPEPMISHWPWIVDAPYAAVTKLFGLALPFETSLWLATLVTPLLLLGVAVWLLSKIVDQLSFEKPIAVLMVSAVAALLGATEFQPGRIDYHSLQMILLLAIVAATMRTGARSAFIAGVLISASLAVSAEMAGFLLVAMAIYSLRFLFNGEGGASELRALGLGLIASSVVCLVLITPPSAYFIGACDRYSLVHLAALAGAGGVFALVSLITTGNFAVRLAALAAGAVFVAGGLVYAFPQCLAGPYGMVSPYLRDTAFMTLPQDGSIVRNADFADSMLFGLLVPAFLGLDAAGVAGFRSWRISRQWAVYGLFAVASLAQAFLVLRMMRVAPLLSGPGLALAIGALLPSFGAVLANRIVGKVPAVALLAPGLALTLGAMLLAKFVPVMPVKIDGVAIAGSCAADGAPALLWPQGSHLLAAPGLSIRMVDYTAHMNVITGVTHPSAAGAEKVYRFFDADTPEPRAYFDAAEATHVATCALNEASAGRLAKDNPFAVALATGHPPAWLAQCPAISGSQMRVYRLSTQPEAFCPTPLR